MLEGIEVKLNTDFFDDKEKWLNIADKVVFTGMIDEFYDYCYGELEYRGLEFEEETLDMENFLGNAVINYTDSKTPYTRIIEHKHFDNAQSEKTIITKEYPKTWTKGEEAYYPINDDRNSELFQKYKDKADTEDNIIFGGRLGMYQYFDMCKVIEVTLQAVEEEKNRL
jgi:UDP-galactopyranose mutase